MPSGIYPRGIEMPGFVELISSRLHLFNCISKQLTSSDSHKLVHFQNAFVKAVEQNISMLTMADVTLIPGLCVQLEQATLSKPVVETVLGIIHSKAAALTDSPLASSCAAPVAAQASPAAQEIEGAPAPVSSSAATVEAQASPTAQPLQMPSASQLFQSCPYLYNYLSQEMWTLQLNPNVSPDDKCRLIALHAHALDVLHPDGDTMAIMCAITGSAGDCLTGLPSLEACEAIKRWLGLLRKKTTQARESLPRKYPEKPADLPAHLYAKAFAKFSPGICPFAPEEMQRRAALVAQRRTHSSLKGHGRPTQRAHGSTRPWLPSGVVGSQLALSGQTAPVLALEDAPRMASSVGPTTTSSAGRPAPLDLTSPVLLGGASVVHYGQLVMQELHKGELGARRLHALIDQITGAPAAPSHRRGPAASSCRLPRSLLGLGPPPARPCARPTKTSRA